MTDTPILWQFMALLAAHYVGDFILQTHWQASNKSKNNMALLEHVTVYTAVIAAVSLALFGLTGLWFAFVWINAAAHFGTDYVTSRWSAKHFARAIASTERMNEGRKMYGEPIPDWAPMANVNPGRHWHNFFAVIGFDQLIHQATLATTLWLIVA